MAHVSVWMLISITILISAWKMVSVEGAKILAMESIASKSRWYLMRSVLRAMTDNGHHVTVFTPFLDGDRENYTEVNLSKHISPNLNIDVIYILENFVKTTSIIPIAVQKSRDVCDVLFENDQWKNISSKGPKQTEFDVIITELLGSECVSYAASALGLPLIYVISTPMITHYERAVFGHHPNTAAVSHILADYAVPKSFVQRLTNIVIMVYSLFATQYKEKMLKYTEPKSYDSATPIQPSLVIFNTHFITDASRPLLPNAIQVGGIHLNPPGVLPKDVLKFIEDSPNGVIYFTFGSVIKMSTLPDHIKKSFKEALAKLPQRILWKYEDDQVEDMPKNVMTKKWFPQRDILLHPKVKLFISHGGISGVYEAVDAGVPILGFPMFYDQPRNIDNLVEAGMAISMDLVTVTKDTISHAVLELVNNEKYLKNAKIASERFKDRPMSPEKSIVYWTEYVIRHKGAPHLRSQALNLTWYQYFLLDVIAAMLILIVIISYIFYTIPRIVKNFIMGSFQNTITKCE